MHLYAASIVATKNGTVSYNIVAIAASSLYEAEGIALDKARKEALPTSEGYTNHGAVVMLVPMSLLEMDERVLKVKQEK